MLLATLPDSCTAYRLACWTLETYRLQMHPSSGYRPA